MRPYELADTGDSMSSMRLPFANHYIQVCPKHVTRKRLNVSKLDSEKQLAALKEIHLHYLWHMYVKDRARQLQGAGVVNWDQLPEFHIWYQRQNIAEKVEKADVLDHAWLYAEGDETEDDDFQFEGDFSDDAETIEEDEEEDEDATQRDKPAYSWNGQFPEDKDYLIPPSSFGSDQYQGRTFVSRKWIRDRLPLAIKARDEILEELRQERSEKKQ